MFTLLFVAEIWLMYHGHNPLHGRFHQRTNIIWNDFSTNIEIIQTIQKITIEIISSD